MMTKFEYMKESLNREYTLTTWTFVMFGRYVEDNDYVKVVDGKLNVKLDDEFVVIDDHNIKDGPLYRTTEQVSIKKGLMKCVKKDINTTYGSILLNSIITEYPFKGNIEYIQGSFNPKDLNQKYVSMMVKDDAGDIENAITVSQYNLFGRSLVFIRTLSQLFVISSTEKSVMPMPNIDKVKEEIKDKIIKKYGTNDIIDPVAQLEYVSLLEKEDRKYLQSDIDNGLFLSKKGVKARSKKFLAFGLTSSIKSDGVFMSESLLDGPGRDPVKIAAKINDGRSGPYNRGVMTRESGVTAALMGRLFGTLKCTSSDCGVRYGKVSLVTKNNYISYIGRTYISGRNDITVKNLSEAKNLIGESYEFRSPAYCKARYCAKCLSGRLSVTPDTLMAAGFPIGAATMTGNLKKMHASTAKRTRIELESYFE